MLTSPDHHKGSTMRHYIREPWQGGNKENPLRLWAYVPGGAIIIADFDASSALRHEVKVENCRRACAAVRLTGDLSNEELERMVKLGLTLDKLYKEVESLRVFKAGVDEALNSGDGSYRP